MGDENNTKAFDQRTQDAKGNGKGLKRKNVQKGELFCC
jgi:hypothetical protein